MRKCRVIIPVYGVANLHPILTLPFVDRSQTCIAVKRDFVG